MEALLLSTGVVALGEMGDKTQLLAWLPAAKFKRPIPIILGILTATLANHILAGPALQADVGLSSCGGTHNGVSVDSRRIVPQAPCAKKNGPEISL